MRKTKNKLSVWEHYLTKEIGIEFKACLYFFCILVFYSLYRLIGGRLEANIIHMAEMICATYVMGYVQVYLLSNFDEGEVFRIKEIFYAVFCSLLYTEISILCEWFDRKIIVSVGFGFYMMLIYICTFLVYKSKRLIDEKLLNDDLKVFQERRKHEEGD